MCSLYMVSLTCVSCRPNRSSTLGSPAHSGSKPFSEQGPRACAAQHMSPGALVTDNLTKPCQSPNVGAVCTAAHGLPTSTHPTSRLETMELAGLTDPGPTCKAPGRSRLGGGALFGHQCCRKWGSSRAPVPALPPAPALRFFRLL